MEQKNLHERRKYSRYDTKVEIYFQVKYDIKTLVRFQVIYQQKSSPEKYPALSRNVSVEGLSFSSNKKLEKGDQLFLEVFLPDAKEPIPMEGEVVWSQLTPPEESDTGSFRTGVKVVSVKGKMLADTIHYDESYRIVWSNLLESVLGDFNQFARKFREK